MKKKKIEKKGKKGEELVITDSMIMDAIRQKINEIKRGHRLATEAGTEYEYK